MQKRLRRTMMFVPGNNPSMMRDAHIYGADSIMFDLEDSVSLAEKDAARLLVYNALKTIDYGGGVEKVVRVNPLSTEFGRADVEAMVRAGADVIRMPKTETAEEITELEGGNRARGKACRHTCGKNSHHGGDRVGARSGQRLQNRNGEQAYDGYRAWRGGLLRKPQNHAQQGGQRGCCSRVRPLVAARAAGIDAVDTVFSNLNDMDTFKEEVRFIKQLGFDGKSVINPRQINPVNEIFTPTTAEIDKAKESSPP